MTVNTLTYETPREYSCDTVEQMDDVKRPAHRGLFSAKMADVTTDGREEEDLGEYVRERGLSRNKHLQTISSAPSRFVNRKPF